MQRFCRLSLIINLLMLWIILIGYSYATDLPKAKVTLFSNVNSVKMGNDLILGVQFKIPKDWETYWRTPGEVGYGAKFSWDGSKNLDKATVLWPYPSKGKSYDFDENVYENEVVFPIKVTLTNPDKPLDIKLNIDYLLCQPGSCVPLNQKLELTIPVEPTKTNAPSTNANLINQALLKIPHTENTQTLAITELKIVRLAKDKATLQVNVNAQNGLKNAELFIEGPEDLKFSVPELIPENNATSHFIFTAERSDTAKGTQSLNKLLDTPLLLTLVNHQEAITVSKTPIAQSNSYPLLSTPYFYILLVLVLICLGIALIKFKKKQLK